MEKHKNEKNLLLLTAHPDDHLVCAGTLMLLRDKGFSVTEIVFTGGERSVWNGNNKKFDKNALIEIRNKELAKASKIIGISETLTLGLPDSNIQRSPELLDKLIQLIRYYKPGIIIAHNPNDYHHDHVEIGRISTEAADRAAWGISTELGGKHRTPALLYMEGCYFARSDILVDISNYFEKKKRVFAAYGSQMNNRAVNMLNSMNVYRGYFKRSDYAESFQIADNYPVYLNEVIEIFSTL